MKIVSDVVTMARKEVWELRYSSRNMLWFLALLAGLSIIFITGDSARGLMSIGMFAQATPALRNVSTTLRQLRLEISVRIDVAAISDSWQSRLASTRARLAATYASV